MAQSIAIRPALSQPLLSFNMENIDTLFPGFMLGDFAVIHGLPSILSLSLLLTVRAQLPYELGGLESDVIFVDGGNTFRLYNVSRLARLHKLNPRKVLQRIFISRAFTAHQMTSIIFEKLEETALKHNAKLVILSDFIELYLDTDIPPGESKEVFTQVTAHLSKMAKEKSLIVLATCPPQDYSRLNAFLQTIACVRSNVTIRIRRKSVHPFDKQFVLEKHPTLKRDCVDFPCQNLTLNDFLGGIQ